jgi:hypothetical protein
MSQLSHRQRLIIVALALPTVVGLAVLAFAYPAARTEPRQLPVGMVGSSPHGRELVEYLNAEAPEEFDLHLYADAASALAAVQDREVYGAFEVSGQSVRLMTASGASPAVAQLLEQLSDSLNGRATSDPHPFSPPEDVVPLSAQDPRGTVFMSCLLPLTICSMLAAAATGLLVRFRPAWRQILALVIVSSLSAAVVYLIGQAYLGAFPHHGVADWGILDLTIFAISTSTAGFIALMGAGGLALGAALMVFIGNPFAGTSSAPELLPDAINHIGQLLPPGAGASALRNAVYFDSNALGEHVVVLLAWSAIGLAALVIGHHAPLQLAAQRLSLEDERLHQAQAGQKLRPRRPRSEAATGRLRRRRRTTTARSATVRLSGSSAREPAEGDGADTGGPFGPRSAAQ